MKRLFLLLFAALVSGTASAQGFLIDQTSINIPTFRNETTDFSTRFNNGCTFVGQRMAFYTNSQLTSLTYAGTLTYPDGTKVISAGGSFDQNFAANGSFGVEKDGQMYFYNFRNGHMQDQFTPTNRYIMVNNHIEFISDTSTSVPYVPAPVHNQEIFRCSVCHETGKCSFCYGKGISPNHAPGIIAACGACNGTGKCTNCKGEGRYKLY